VAPPDDGPPSPWLAVDGGQVWRMTAASAVTLEPGGALAPYPGLVSLGMNETGRVMADLEVAHGLIALRGPADTVRAVLAAIAVELVTSRWSDRMRVTLVGFGQGLETMAGFVVAGDVPGASWIWDVTPDGRLRTGMLGFDLSAHLLKGAHATGDEEVLRAVVSEISARAALDEVLPRLSPETEALIDELLPSWRSSAA
jgi:hypothetical protein